MLRPPQVAQLGATPAGNCLAIGFFGLHSIHVAPCTLQTPWWDSNRQGRLHRARYKDLLTNAGCTRVSKSSVQNEGFELSTQIGHDFVALVNHFNICIAACLHELTQFCLYVEQITLHARMGLKQGMLMVWISGKRLKNVT